MDIEPTLAWPFGIRGVFPLEIPGLHHAGDAIEVVNEVVIELAVGVVPQLVVGVDDRPVEVEHFHRLLHVRLEHVHRRADVVGERAARVVEVHPHEAAEAHLRLHRAQPASSLQKRSW
jgi:hypothetical protein